MERSFLRQGTVGAQDCESRRSVRELARWTAPSGVDHAVSGAGWSACVSPFRTCQIAGLLLLLNARREYLLPIEYVSSVIYGWNHNLEGEQFHRSAHRFSHAMPPVCVSSPEKQIRITMAGLWARYNKLLEAQPLLTKALTSLTGFTVGDVLAQSFIENEGKPYDVMRTVRMGSFGFLLHGTTGHYFYGFLDGKLPGTAPITVATKVAIDQTIWNPIFGCMFFGYLNFVEGKSFEEYQNKLKADLKVRATGLVARFFLGTIFAQQLTFFVHLSFRGACSSFVPSRLL